MDGPSHYRESERLLADCVDHEGNPPVGEPDIDQILAAAQVHATLALAAATALPENPLWERSRNGQAWHDAAGTKASTQAGRP